MGRLMTGRQKARSCCGPGKTYREGADYVTKNGNAAYRKGGCVKKGGGRKASGTSLKALRAMAKSFGMRATAG